MSLFGPKPVITHSREGAFAATSGSKLKLNLILLARPDRTDG
jgi:hypothetical protein